MASKADRIAILESAVNELKVLHNAISTSYDSIKSKALALLAGEITIITFLFAGSSVLSGKVSISDITVSTAMFYLIGGILLTLAFASFLHVIYPVQWKQPPETEVVRHLEDWFDNDKEKFLKYLQEDYIKAIEVCNAKLSGKAKRFVFAIYLLTSGILILVLLKYGKGTIKI